MKLTNSLTNQKEEFVTLEPNIVKMYGCGITVSGDAHIGHALQALIFDVLRNYLQYKGYKVNYVRNYTDINDSIIENAKKAGISSSDFAVKYLNRIDNDLKRFKVAKANTECKATEYVGNIIEFVQKLIEKGYAYESDGDVYFDVSKFHEYGKLSNRTTDELLTGVRKDIVGDKKDDKDFALWKSEKGNEVAWDSPWGRGRPGWHIECSAMIKGCLGEQIDIHGGGRDLIFPHHENEIAQSEALTGKPLARYWVHCGLVKVNGVKMSKSLGNSLMLSDVLDQYNDEVIKFALLQGNYKSDVNITDNMFADSEKHMYHFYNTLAKIKGKYSDEQSDFAKNIYEQFDHEMDNDLNTAKTLADLFNIENKINDSIKNKENLSGVYNAIIKCYNVLDIFQYEPKQFIDIIKNKYLTKNNITEKEIEQKIEERSNCKKEKNYQKADEIKNYLISKNIYLKDTPLGTNWDIMN